MARVVSLDSRSSGQPLAVCNSFRLNTLAIFLFAVIFVASEAVFGAETPTGQAIYKEECSRCHGPMGEGTKKTTRPLVGEKSPAQLVPLLRRSMPDDDPGSLTDEQYQQAATYIYDTFYSTDAQARLHPPRVALSHLTVIQYRSTVADLIGGFRSAAKVDARQGLRGEYYNSSNTRNDKRLIDRIDPVVNFDFGTDGPDAPSSGEKFSPDQFSMEWQGSVFAAETGDYDFIVHTEMALRLWVNDLNKPLIDAMVKSGSDTEYRATVFLVAGRTYSIRLDVSKGREIKDKDKNKMGGAIWPTKASVALLWKVPHHQADEIIPARCLSPVQSPEVAVIQTAFPPDDRSYGWERGTTVSKEWVSAATDAAMDVAGYVGEHLQELSGASGGSKDREGKLKSFCKAFAERAFRRPLTDAEAREFVDRQFENGADPDLAVKRIIIRVMISPEFFYPGQFDEHGAGSESGARSYAVAARLALSLWDSLPDKALLRAATEGKLSTRPEIATQAERMLDDPRARLKVRQALLAWLRVDQSPELVKDAKKFPDFNAAFASDLRTSLELFLDDVISSKNGDFRQLLLSDDLFLNGRLAQFYGADLPPDSDFTNVRLEPEHRAGVLTQPYMLATFAYPGESSPIHRGVFMIRGILGITLRPPANASFTPFSADEHPGLTTRERITLQTSTQSCSACHSVINPLGFALEQFDAVGRHRDMENGKAIDAGGHYETRRVPSPSSPARASWRCFLPIATRRARCFRPADVSADRSPARPGLWIG